MKGYSDQNNNNFLDSIDRRPKLGFIKKLSFVNKENLSSQIVVHKINKTYATKLSYCINVQCFVSDGEIDITGFQLSDSDSTQYVL